MSPKNAATRFIGFIRFTSSPQYMKTLPVSNLPTKTSRTESHMMATTAADHDRRDHERLRLDELRQLHVGAEEIVVAALEASDLELLAAERLDDALALQDLRQVGGQIGDALLCAVRARSR